MYNIDTNSAPINNLNSLKLPAFVLTAHTRQHLDIILSNNPYLTFKERPFNMLALKSGMGYQLLLVSNLILKNSFKTISRTKLVEIIETENSYAEIVNNYSMSPRWI